MGRRKRERVARIGAGIEKANATPLDPQERAKRGLCPFPGCQGDPLRGAGTHGFCFTHERLVSDLLFILPRIEWHQPKPKSELVVPGSPEFSMLPKNRGGERHGSL